MRILSHVHYDTKICTTLEFWQRGWGDWTYIYRTAQNVTLWPRYKIHKWPSYGVMTMYNMIGICQFHNNVANFTGFTVCVSKGKLLWSCERIITLGSRCSCPESRSSSIICTVHMGMPWSLLCTDLTWTHSSSTDNQNPMPCCVKWVLYNMLYIPWTQNLVQVTIRCKLIHTNTKEIYKLK